MRHKFDRPNKRLYLVASGRPGRKKPGDMAKVIIVYSSHNEGLFPSRNDPKI